MMAIVTAGWQRKLSRLTQMSWDEIRTRIAQEGSKRWDLARYRSGLKQSRLRLQASPRSARFFFDVSELKARVGLIREHLPQEFEKTLCEARAICSHEFDLLGYEKLDYGPEIDWHLDAVHGKRAPLKPWFKIDFLNFQEVGDHKVTWELNRHQHLVTLAKAWCFTNDRRFSDELVAQWVSWHKANPYPLGVNWASTLEVAFRGLSWLWVRQLMTGCDSLPNCFHRDLLDGLQRHGSYIERYLSTYFSPNTHLLGEAVALFFLGTLCPEIPQADRWQQRGLEVVLNEAGRQVRPDGVYFEQALYYHVYALDFFLYARILAGLNEIKLPAAFDAVLRTMLDVLDALSQTGVAEGFGDDDGGRVFNPRRNQVEHMTDPLAIGAVYYGPGFAAATLTEESVWLFGDKAVARLRNNDQRQDLTSRAFPSGGLYVMADDQPCVQSMMIDGGPQGIGRSGHGHADALSLRFSLDGQRVLIDPGAGVYIGDNSDRNLFRGTGSHNTIQIDGLDQAVPEGPFSWSAIPKVQTERWLAGETFDLFIGSHDGYCRLADPVLHRRTLFHAKGGVWVVRDVLTGKEVHSLQSFWHFAPQVIVEEAAGQIAARWDSAEGTTRGALLSAASPAWKAEVLPGLVSPAYGAKETAPVACFSATLRLPVEHAAAFILSQPLAASGRFDEIREGESHGVRGYRHDTATRTWYLFFADNGTWRCGPWSSDAAVLYCAVDEGHLAHLVMVSGSFAKWHNRDMVAHHAPVERFEWRNKSGKTEIFSSDRTAAEHTAAMNFEFFDPVL
jgi:hypothetical protein